MEEQQAILNDIATMRMLLKTPTVPPDASARELEDVTKRFRDRLVAQARAGGGFFGKLSGGGGTLLVILNVLLLIAEVIKQLQQLKKTR